MKNIALIPAKGFSQRIKNKNMINICGKPLIFYSIKSALKSKSISEVWVNSDCEKILNFSKKMGCYCFSRSKKLCENNTSLELVIEDFIKYYNNYDNIVLIQPTSPYLTYVDLDNAIHKLENYDSIISVTHFKKFLWEFNNNLKSLTLKNGRINSQNMDEESYPYFQENGSFYIFSLQNFIKNKNRYGNNVGHYTMNYSLELDWESDISPIKKLMKNLIKKGYWNEL